MASCNGEGFTDYYSSKLKIIHTKHKWMGLYATKLSKVGRKLPDNWWEVMTRALKLERCNY